MDLWIRSQDRTILSKAQNIIIRENQNENNETNYAIVDIYTIGIYKSEERALEVLDEIQSFIDNRGFSKLNNTADGIEFEVSTNGTVYEMPKE